MMKRSHRLFLALASALVLGGCGDRVQTIGTGESRHADSNAWDVGSSDPYVASGWSPGDKASWEDHLRRRTQMQNDYAPR